jgi:3-dehydroquinate synthase
MSHSVISVATAQKSYDILIGAGVLTQGLPVMAEVLPPAKTKICVVTDENVAKIYLIPFMRALEAQGYTCYPPVILPAGEGVKNFKQLEAVIDKVLSYKLDRSAALVALGGGVVGDITGFAASVLLRGIRFVQVPTTLLAQVDSSVGGKTGINTAQGKNLVGSFYQPDLVLIDTDTLATLPERELKAGYAEVLKYALINDEVFFEWLEKYGKAVIARDPVMVKSAIETSCRAKAAIVAADEREQKDLRALLNLGHTFGHALEAIGNYDGRLLHGEAVAIGMRLAFDFSVNKGLCNRDEAMRVGQHMDDVGLIQKAPFDVEEAVMIEWMRGDKKNAGNRLTLILAEGIGRAFVSRYMEEKDLTGWLQSALR